MTGQDLIFWLDNLGFDLVNFGQADVLSLIFRIFLFVVVVVILWSLVESLIKRFSGIMRHIWEFFLIPIRFPRKILREKERREQRQKNQEAWEQSQREQEKRVILQQKEDEKMRRKEREAIEKALRLD